MSVQTARRRVPRRQEQLAAVVAALPTADETPPATAEPAESEPEVRDLNRERAQKCLDKLTEYGIQVPMADIRQEAVRRALVLVLLDNLETLIDRGLITEAQMAARVHALEADAFAHILMQVEQQRLTQAEQAKRPVAATMGNIIVPGRQ